jgi:radical SAM superfamily enzyme YgiQ (UPF0313 family)
MKKILLVNPWIHDFAAHDHWAKPMGLLYIASILRSLKYDIRYLDCLISSSSSYTDSGLPMPKRKSDGRGAYHKEEIPKPPVFREIPKRYRRYGCPPSLIESALSGMDEPDLVLVTSFMTYWYPGVAEAIEHIRTRWRKVPVILGGVYATLCTDHAKQHSGADFVIPGDGIDALPSILEDVFDQKHDMPTGKDNLDDLPYPAFDLLPFLDQVPILTSRGCPFRCTYCASARMEPFFRRRDPHAVADEIAYWHTRHGIRNFSFYDDALLVNPDEMIRPLAREIIRRGLRLQFHCPNGLHLRELNEELGRLLFESGFRTLRFGFETVDVLRQRETGGKTGSDDLKAAMECLRKAGYRNGETGIYLLCGLPGQGVQEIEEGIDFVRSCGARPILAEYSPIPGTALWDEAVDASPHPIADEPLFHNNSLLPCAEKELTIPVFRELKRRALVPLDG